MSELAKALAKVQAELRPIARTQKGQAGNRKHMYADLSTVEAVVFPLLAKNGLAFIAKPMLREDGKFILAYSLVHESGEREDGTYPMHAGGTPQQLGSEVTYARRYALCAITGAAAEGEDDDGHAASHSPEPRAQIRQPRAARPQNETPPHRSAHADAEHARLAQGTVEGRQSGGKRGPVPDDEDQWATPQGGNGVIGAIAQHFKRLEVTDREERLAYTAMLAGCTAITSTKDLDDGQRATVLGRLAKLRDHSQLVALVTNGDAP